MDIREYFLFPLSVINALIFMNMIIGVIIDVVVRENDSELPENIALLTKIDQIIKLNQDF